MGGGALALALLTGAAQAEERPAEAAAPAVPPAPATQAVSFDEAIRQALARNPTVAQARAQVQRAQALVTESRAAFLPILTGNAVYTQLDHARVQNDRVVQPGSAFNANFNLTVPLVAPQKWLATSRAQEGVEVARGGEADVRRQVATSVAQAYLAVVLQRRLVESSIEARDTARLHLDFAKARRVQGLGNRLDEVRSEREVHDDEARVQLAASSLSRAQEALGVAVGADVPLDAAGDPTLTAVPSVQEALSSVDSREDVAVTRARLRLAERTLKDSWADFAPTLAAAAQPFLQTPETTTLPTWGFQAQVLLSVPLYDGGFRYGARHEREALVADARSALDSLLQRARGEVRSSVEQLQGAEAASTEQQRSADSARETLQLATTAYRAGATTNLEVIDAERSARDAETNALLAEDSVRQARLNLLIASGRFPGTPAEH